MDNKIICLFCENVVSCKQIKENKEIVFNNLPCKKFVPHDVFMISFDRKNKDTLKDFNAIKRAIINKFEFDCSISLKDKKINYTFIRKES